MSTAAACGALRRKVALRTQTHLHGIQQASLFSGIDASPMSMTVVQPRPSQFNGWRFQSSKAPASSSSAQTTHVEMKRAKKERRSDLFQIKQERLKKLETRRDGRANTGAKKKEFKAWFDKRKVFQEISDRKARQLGLDWSIRVVAVLERLPIVTPDKPQWEVDFMELDAYLKSYGKQYPKELGMGEPGTPAPVLTEEELIALLPEGFTPAPRVTEADKTGNVKTMDRRLASRVYLAVQRTEKENTKWGFPSVSVEGEETLLEAAQRAVAQVAGKELELWCGSNSPCAMDMSIPPEDQRVDGKYGTKTFFMRVQHDEGNVDEETLNGLDYAWLDRSEMVERVLAERGVGPSKFYHYMLPP